MESYELIIGVVIASLCVAVGYLRVNNKGLYTVVKFIAYAMEFTHKLLNKIDKKMMEMFLTRYFKMSKSQQEKLYEKVSPCLDFVSDNIKELKEELNITDEQVKEDVDAFVDTVVQVKDEVDITKEKINGFKNKVEKNLKEGE